MNQINRENAIGQRVTGPNEKGKIITGRVIGTDTQVRPMSKRGTFLVVYEDGKTERNWIDISQATKV